MTKAEENLTLFKMCLGDEKDIVIAPTRLMIESRTHELSESALDNKEKYLIAGTIIVPKDAISFLFDKAKEMNMIEGYLVIIPKEIHAEMQGYTHRITDALTQSFQYPDKYKLHKQI